MTLSAIVAKIVSGFAAVLSGIEMAITLLQFIVWMVMMSRQTPQTA